jgi:hypothetical protein
MNGLALANLSEINLQKFATAYKSSGSTESLSIDKSLKKIFFFEGEGVSTSAILSSVWILESKSSTHQILRIIYGYTTQACQTLSINNRLDQSTINDAIAWINMIIELECIVKTCATSLFDLDAKPSS